MMLPFSLQEDEEDIDVKKLFSDEVLDSDPWLGASSSFTWFSGKFKLFYWRAFDITFLKI